MTDLNLRPRRWAPGGVPLPGPNPAGRTAAGRVVLARIAGTIRGTWHLVERARAWRRDTALAAQLARMDDHILADIGLTRDGITAAVTARSAMLREKRLSAWE